MAELSVAYHRTRRRISDLVVDLGEDELGRRVPACPDWDVHDLVAHVSGIPEAVTSGDLPGADRQAWLDGLVTSRRGTPIAEMLERWDSCAEATSAFIDSGVSLVFVDLVAHEHDLRGALVRPGERGSAEVRAIVQGALELLVPAIKAARVGALVIDSDGVQWASHLARPGCTLQVDPWEASRMLVSRRTAEEMRALPHTGDIEPYIAAIADHFPLPVESLRER